MSDAFIPLELGKFQMCCVPGCEGDAIGEHKKTIKAGTIYMGYCYRRGHNTQVKKLCTSTTEISRDWEHAFIQPSGASRKCKVTVFLGKPYTPPQEVTKPKKKAPQMPRSFMWTNNYRKWRNVEGCIVPVYKLTDVELLSAIYRIKEANYKRASQKTEWIKWLKDLPDFSMVVYPEGSLNVGTNMAYDKLEELRVIAKKRFLV